LSLTRALAVAALRPRPPRGALSPAALDGVRRLLVVRAHDQLGDFLLAGPALAALRRRFAAARITLVVNRFLAPLARHHPDADRVLVAPWGRGAGAAGGAAGFWAALRDEPYDLAVVLNTVSHSLSSDATARLAGARVVAGPAAPPLKDTPGAPLYDWAYDPAPPAGPHEMDRALAAVAPLGGPGAPLAYRFALTPAERAAAERLRATLSAGRLVALHVGTKDPAKRYPTALWIAAADAVAERLGARLALLDAPDARAAGAELARGLRAAHTPLPPLTLRETAAFLTHAELLLCHDSALLHLAAAVGVPTVSVHGRGDAARWKPPGARHVALQAPDYVPASVPPEQVAAAALAAVAAGAGATAGPPPAAGSAP